MSHRIYVASPYSDPDPAAREANVKRSVLAAAACMKLGHDAFSPLAATHPVAVADPSITYEQYMRLDFSFISRWATAILVLAQSPGVCRELALAWDFGLTVFRSVDEIPPARPDPLPTYHIHAPTRSDLAK